MDDPPTPQSVSALLREAGFAAAGRYRADKGYRAAWAGEIADERRAKRQAAYEAWKARVNEVLMLHIGLIDEELCEQTARFLAGEAWLIDGKPELENRHILLIAKAVGYENRRDGAAGS